MASPRRSSAVPICAPTTHRTARRSSLQCCCRPPRFSPLSSRPLATRKEPPRPRPSTLDSAARTTSPARRHCTSRSRRAKMPWSRCCSSTAHKSTRKPMSLDNRVPHHSTLHADCMYLTDHPLPSHHHVAHTMLSLSLLQWPSKHCANTCTRWCRRLDPRLCWQIAVGNSKLRHGHCARGCTSRYGVLGCLCLCFCCYFLA